MSEGEGLLNTLFNTTAEVQSANGCLPSAISITLIPSAHTSLFSTVFPSYTSGAMYNEVPHAVFLLEQECSNCTANPKSPTFTTPLSDKNKLSGLMS